MCGVIVVDACRSPSTYLGRDAYIMIIALDIVISMCFSINCPTVICLPTVCYALKREASSENYGPRVIYHCYINKNHKNTLLQFIYFYFILQFTLSIYLSLRDLILAINRRGD